MKQKVWTKAEGEILKKTFAETLREEGKNWEGVFFRGVGAGMALIDDRNQETIRGLVEAGKKSLESSGA